MQKASNRKKIFVCTKPLQMMVAMILNKPSVENLLYIVDSFHSAKLISESSLLKRRFLGTQLFSNRNKAILAAAKQHPAIIFIDSDIGLKTQLTLLAAKILAPKTAIHVYEEGIGTYRTDIITPLLKQIIYKMTGTARHFGGSVFSNKIWVFDPDLYSHRIPHLKHKALPINPTLMNWIKDHQQEMISLFSSNIKLPESSNRDAAYLYLSDWSIDPQALETLNSLENAFIKPHPHIQDEIICKIKPTTTAIWLPPSCPAEVILLILCIYYKVVYVKHNNSTAVTYMRNLNNLIEFDTLPPFIFHQSSQ